MAQGAEEKTAVLRPGGQFFAGLDHERHRVIDIVLHRRMIGGDHRFAAGHEFHQRQTQTFAVRGVDIETGTPVKLCVLLIVQITVNHHHPTGERCQLRQRSHQMAVAGRQIARGDFQHQRSVGGITERPAESREDLKPVLASIRGVQNGYIDHAVDGGFNQ
ncbi:hypothetical protein D9M71_648820 [compost metagenome]